MKLKIWILALLVSIAVFSFVSQAQNLSDHQIAEILEEANDAEIEAAKLAKGDATNKEVKEFAKHMIEQHKKNNKETKKVVKKADIDPEESEISKAIKADAKNKKDILKKQRDLAFDRMYMEQQVSMHQQLLNDLDQKYIPAAQNPDFKNHLKVTREHVSQHLEKARALEAKL